MCNNIVYSMCTSRNDSMMLFLGNIYCEEDPECMYNIIVQYRYSGGTGYITYKSPFSKQSLLTTEPLQAKESMHIYSRTILIYFTTVYFFNQVSCNLNFIRSFPLS